MNNMDLAKGLIFQKLDVDNTTFEERLILQKKIYLLKELGVDLGYNYNWYVHGPYSPELTSYVYENLELLNVYDYKDLNLQNDVNLKIDKINALKDYRKIYTEKDWYELLASVLYIERNKDLWKEKDAKKILMNEKPKFNEIDYDNAMEVLKEVNFI